MSLDKEVSSLIIQNVASHVLSLDGVINCFLMFLDLNDQDNLLIPFIEINKDVGVSYVVYYENYNGTSLVKSVPLWEDRENYFSYITSANHKRFNKELIPVVKENLNEVLTKVDLREQTKHTIVISLKTPMTHTDIIKVLGKK